MNPLSGWLRWKLQKNKPLVDALITGRAPDFVVKRKPPATLSHVPVFTFHVAIPEYFEEQCAHISENGYHTLSADELKRVMQGTLKPPPQSVVLTFDDGLKQVWSVAYPILKKHGLKAMVFLIPGCIEDNVSAPLRPTMEDVWAGRTTADKVFGIWPDESPLATWPEITEMHESGVLDFQSHTMWHSLVYKTADIVDFGRPDYDRYYVGNIYVPMYQVDGADATHRDLSLGMPIYSSAPRMQTSARYFDDQGLREHCIETVDSKGGATFFQDPNWRKEMAAVARDYRQQHESAGRFESPSERDEAIKCELRAAKQAIEERLPGKTVEHLCFPWYKAPAFAHRCALATGHALTYYDNEPDFLVNIPGTSDRIARVEENYLRRLPGHKRMTKREIIGEAFALRKLGQRMFPQGYANGQGNAVHD